MLHELIRLAMPHRRISVLGMSKNAGKTTALNAIIGGFCNADLTLGITSIGRDGETTDTVTATAKPRIYVPSGVIAATAASLLPLCSVTREILTTTGISTQLGEIVIIKTRSAGFVELAGASTVSGLNSLSEIMHSLGAQRILIDGALSRKSLCRAADAVILSVGASSQDIEEVVEDAAFVCSLFNLPKHDKNTTANTKTIDGALTDAGLSRIIKSGASTTLVVEDAGKILCSRKTAALFFALGGSIELTKPIRLIALTANPLSVYGYEFNAEVFKKTLSERTGLPVFDVYMEGIHYDL